MQKSFAKLDNRYTDVVSLQYEKQLKIHNSKNMARNLLQLLKGNLPIKNKCIFISIRGLKYPPLM